MQIPGTHTIFPTRWLALLMLCGTVVVAPLFAEARDSGLPELQLRVAEEQRALFVPMGGRERIPYTELDLVFGSMLNRGDDYCRMLYRHRKYDREQVALFIENDQLDAFRASHKSSYLSKLVAGCWNFFIMNDIRPFLDFELARELYPDRSYDCYSVGFMQPYIMHNIMGCETLQMLDIDWRIHAAHWQMLEMYREGAFATRKAATRAIGRLELGWIAFAGTAPAPRHPVSIATLCRHNRDLCLDHLVRFQGNMARLRDVRLDLAALHNGEFRTNHDAEKTPDGRLKVIYLSNAVENIYTTRAQFDLLLARVSGTLPENGRALYIYHAAGTRALGFYEQTRSDAVLDGYTVKTICRDTYRRRDANNELENYTTHFEKISQQERPPGCQSLLRKAKLI